MFIIRKAAWRQHLTIYLAGLALIHGLADAHEASEACREGLTKTLNVLNPMTVANVPIDRGALDRETDQLEALWAYHAPKSLAPLLHASIEQLRALAAMQPM